MKNSCDGIRLSSHRQRVRLHGMHAIQPCAPTCKITKVLFRRMACTSPVTNKIRRSLTASLLTYHNIRYQMRLCEQMHQVTYPTSKHVDDASTASVGFSSVAFQNEFPGLTMSLWKSLTINWTICGALIRRRFPEGHIPPWVRDALSLAGISL